MITKSPAVILLARTVLQYAHCVVLDGVPSLVTGGQPVLIDAFSLLEEHGCNLRNGAIAIEDLHIFIGGSADANKKTI